MAYQMDVRQRKNMAMGKGDMPSQDFGCTDMATCSVPHMDADGKGDRRVMDKDDARGAGKPMMHSKGKMPAQRAPDHGPH